MSTPNRVSAEIPAAVITDVTTKLNEVTALLKPYLQALTEQERQDIPKMADKTFAFVTKTAAYTVSNPEFAPGFMDVPEFNKDFKLSAALKPMLDISKQLCDNLGDTAMLGGSESFVAALVYYGGVRMAAKNGEPAARAIYDDLKLRFPGRKKNSTPPPPPIV